jgi:hypothetical protein
MQGWEGECDAGCGMRDWRGVRKGMGACGRLLIVLLFVAWENGQAWSGVEERLIGSYLVTVRAGPEESINGALSLASSRRSACSYHDRCGPYFYTPFQPPQRPSIYMCSSFYIVHAMITC